MRRLIVSTLSGVILPVVLYFSYFWIGGYFDSHWKMAWVAKLLFVLGFWPLIIWDVVFQQPASSGALVGAAVILFLFWFGFAYLLQTFIAQLWRNRSRVPASRRA